MGKKRRRKNNERKHARGYRTRTVQLWLDGLEIARGHDGLLRGNPEPVVVLAAYVVGDGRVSCVMRHLVRYRVPKRPPVLAKARHGGRVAFAAQARAHQLLFLALAVEEDEGTGVQQAYAAAGHGDELSFWSDDELLPDPLPLSKAAPLLARRPGVHRIHLLDGGQDLGRSMTKDDWVGAAAWAHPWEQVGYGKRILRVPLRSDDDRNDWTLPLEIRLSG